MDVAVDRCAPRSSRDGGASRREGGGRGRGEHGEGGEGTECWSFKGCLILAGGWSKAAECYRADEGMRMCTPVYSICSADLVDVTSQFTGSHGDVVVKGRKGFTNERVQSPA